MSDDWVNVYPLDECTAFYADELDRLAAAAAIATASAQKAQLWLNCSVGIADAFSMRAPLTYGVLRASLQNANFGPAGLVPLGNATADLADSLSTAREIYTEAEWTLTRVMEEQARNGIQANAVGWFGPFIKDATKAIEVAQLMAELKRIWDAQEAGANGIELQQDMRALGLRLQALFGPPDGVVETRDGPQGTAGRAPVQGAALLLLAWLNLVRAVQTVTVRQVPVAGAPTGEMDTAVIERIGGLPEAIRWIEVTRSLNEDNGQVSLASTTRADGSRAWTVLIPGTQTLLGGSNPQDWESNLEMTAGLSSELLAGVAAILKAAPIQAGESITMIGHSQGGIVAAALASNPELRKEYQIDAIVTVGSPVGQFDSIPNDVLALHLEDINDIVPPVDGLANTPSERHVTLVFDPEVPASWAHSHENYAQLLEKVAEQGNSPQLDRMSAAIGEVAGWGGEGEARLYTYQFGRNELSPSLPELLVGKVRDAVF